MEVEMKIKRYMAVSMRAALAQVRAEQGPDAVILSSRRVEEGIEVIAAVDYDEALFADATLKRAPVAPPEAEAPVLTPEPVRAMPQVRTAAVGTSARPSRDAPQGGARALAPQAAVAAGACSVTSTARVAAASVSPTLPAT